MYCVLLAAPLFVQFCAPRITDHTNNLCVQESPLSQPLGGLEPLPEGGNNITQDSPQEQSPYETDR